MSKGTFNLNQMVSARQVRLQFVIAVKAWFDTLIKDAKVFAKNEQTAFNKSVQNIQNKGLQLMEIQRKILEVNHYISNPESQLYLNFFTLGKKGLAKRIKTLSATDDDEYYLDIVRKELNRTFQHPSMPREITEAEKLQRHLLGTQNLKITWGSYFFIQSLNKMLSKNAKQNKAVSSKVSSNQPKFGLPKDIATDFANEIAGYFNNKDISELKKALQGKVLKDKILFKGSSKQFCGILWEMHLAKIINHSKILTKDWLCVNFLFMNQQEKSNTPFNPSTTINNLSTSKNPCVKSKRINISSFIDKHKKN